MEGINIRKANNSKDKSKEIKEELKNYNEESVVNKKKDPAPGISETELESLSPNEKFKSAVDDIKEKLDVVEGKILAINGITDVYNSQISVFSRNSVLCDYDLKGSIGGSDFYFDLGNTEIAGSSREYENAGSYNETYTIMGRLVDGKTYEKFIDYVKSEIDEKTFKIHRQDISPKLKEEILNKIDLKRKFMQEEGEKWQEEGEKWQEDGKQNFEGNVEKLRNFLRIPEKGTDGEVIEKKKTEIENAIKAAGFEYKDWSFESKTWYLSETGKVSIVNLFGPEGGFYSTKRSQCLIEICTKGDAGKIGTGLTRRDGSSQIENFHLNTRIEVRGKPGESVSDFEKRIEKALENII